MTESRDKHKNRPLPGSSHTYLEDNIKRNEQLLGVKSRKGIGFKGHYKRVKTMRPGSRHHNLKKRSDIMLENLLKLAGVAAPEDADKTSGQAYDDYYQAQDKANKANTKADEATWPEGKEDMQDAEKVAKSAFWEGFCKIARAHGLDNIQTLGMCAVLEGRTGPSESDLYIHRALTKIAMEDAAGCKDYGDRKANHGLAEGVQAADEADNPPGSPLQNVKKTEERALKLRDLTMDAQYSGDGPLDRQDPKEAAFRAGFNEMLKRAEGGGMAYSSEAWDAPMHGALGGGVLGGLGGLGLGYMLAPEDAGLMHYLPYAVGGGALGAGLGYMGGRQMKDESGISLNGGESKPKKTAPKKKSSKTSDETVEKNIRKKRTLKGSTTK